MIGGHNKGNKVEMYDSNLEEWISLNDIKAYSDKHSCILLPKIQKSEHDRILVLSSLRYVLLAIKGRIICNRLYSIGTPKVFWH